MDCPFCFSSIDDDSFFCDQCGKEILVCSECGKPGAAKRCIHDGKKLVPAGEAAEFHKTGTGTPVEPAGLHLINNTLELDIQPTAGQIIGRREGEFTHIFANFGTVSGTHAKIDKDPQGNWTITDLDSTNGTWVGKEKCPPHRPVPLKNGDYIKIANIEFIVSLETPEGGDTDKDQDPEAGSAATVKA